MAREYTPWSIGRSRHGSLWGGRRTRRKPPGFENLESRFLLSQGDGLDRYLTAPPVFVRNLASSDDVAPVRSMTAPADAPTSRQATNATGELPAPMVEIQAVPALQGPGPENWGGPRSASSGWSVDHVNVPAEPESGTRDAETVLFETRDQHATTPTAQTLPEAATIRVQGTLHPEDVLDLYRMPLPPGFQSMRIGLNVSRPSSESPEHLVLIDEAGRVIDSHAVDLKSGQLWLVVRETGSLAGRALFVGIYRPHPADGLPPVMQDDFGPSPVGGGRETTMPEPQPGRSSGAGTSYDLSFTTDLDPTDGSSGPESPSRGDEAAGPVPESDTPRLSVPPASTAGFGQSMAPRSSSLDAVDFQAVIGIDNRPARLSPLRSGTSRAGIFATGPVTRPVDRRMAVVVDMSLIDQPRPTGPDSPDDDAPSLSPDEDSPEFSGSTVRRPGGLPVEGAPTPLNRSTTDFAPLVWELQKSRPSASPQRTPLSSQLDAIQPVTDLDAVSPRRGTGAQAALRAGFSLAYGLAFTFLLPDLTTRFQNLMTRTRPRLRTRLLRRLFGDRAAR